ncbi:MAG TPA: hypothetical protein VLC95_04240, partial [Anaerolineae bacterium]|nr:hypothetical protein [Anaerolineae bacterium]
SRAQEQAGSRAGARDPAFRRPLARPTPVGEWAVAGVAFLFSSTPGRPPGHRRLLKSEER